MGQGAFAKFDRQGIDHSICGSACLFEVVNGNLDCQTSY